MLHNLLNVLLIGVLSIYLTTLLLVMPCLASVRVVQMCAIYFLIIIRDSILRKHHLRKITGTSAVHMRQTAGQIFTKICCLGLLYLFFNVQMIDVYFLFV